MRRPFITADAAARWYTKPLLVAVVTTLLALAWQAATVHCNYDGRWTALFCVGDRQKLPTTFKELPYLFKNSSGYDGQYFLIIARDPLARHGSARFVKASALRYRRILVPGLGWLLAFGQEPLVDASMIAVQLGFFFLGVFSAACFCTRFGASAWLGAGYALIPGALISLDRQLADGPQLAFTAAFFLLAYQEEFFDRHRPLLMWSILAVAPLARETGVMLLGGYCLSLLLRGRVRDAVRYATAILPVAAWSVYVEKAAVAYSNNASLHAIRNFAVHDHGWFECFWHLPKYTALAPFPATIVHGLDVIALLSLPAIWAVVIARLWRRPRGAPEWATLLLAVLISCLAWPNFTDPFGYTRLISPILLFVAVDGVRTRRWWPLLFSLPVVLRILIQFVPQGLGILRWAAG